MQKSLFLTVLSVGLLAASCTKREVEAPFKPDPVAISLGAGVIMPVTKAPVIGGETLTCGIAGWENIDEETYDSSPLWSTTVTTVASAESQPVTWAEQMYYNGNEEISTYIRSWYPAGAIEGSTVSFENTAGDVDVLWAAPVEGNAADAESKTLSFAHSTSQLRFKAVAGTGMIEGTKLLGITIEQAALPVGFDLSAAADADAVVYGSARPLAVSGIGKEGITVTPEAAAVGDHVMIKPFPTNMFTVEIVTDQMTYKTIVSVDGEAVKAGTSYEITLTFSRVGITADCTIEEWINDTGSADVF